MDWECPIGGILVTCLIPRPLPRYAGVIITGRHMAISSADTGKQICEALGLDPNKISRISVEYLPDSVVIAHVQYAISDEQHKVVVQTLGGAKVVTDAD